MTRQRRRLSRLLLVIIAALAWVALLSIPWGGLGASQGADGTTARVTRIDDTAFPRVTSYMLLRDKSGEPIEGLQATDFHVAEDGIPVQFEFAGAGQQPLSVILVIDQSGSMQDGNKMAGAQSAARAFVDLLRPGRDKLGVEAFSDELNTLVPFAAVDDNTDKSSAQAAINSITPNGDTYLYSAVAEAVEHLQGTGGRRVVIALTDGRSNDQQMTADESTTLAKEAGVPVYTIGLGGDVDERQLQKLAEATDGQYFYTPGPEQLQELYRDLAHALQNEYSFTYTSPTPRLDGTRRAVAVTTEYATGELTTSDDYAVAGVLALRHNTFLLLLLGGGLLSLLGIPSLLGRLRKRTVTQEQTETLPNPKEAVQLPTAAISTEATAGTPELHSSGKRMRITSIRLGDERTTLGSAADNDIVLPGLAAHHATISRRAGRWVIVPQAGETAVSYNGDPAVERTITSANALRDGSLIRLGPVQAIFQGGDEPSLLFHGQVMPIVRTGRAAPLPS